MEGVLTVNAEVDRFTFSYRESGEAKGAQISRLRARNKVPIFYSMSLSLSWLAVQNRTEGLNDNSHSPFPRAQSPDDGPP